MASSLSLRIVIKSHTNVILAHSVSRKTQSAAQEASGVGCSRCIFGLPSRWSTRNAAIIAGLIIFVCLLCDNFTCSAGNVAHFLWIMGTIRSDVMVTFVY